MSAALLREAAKAMRERAEAATPGPWRALTTGVQGGDHWYVCDAGEALAWIAAQDGVNEEQREPDAAHIASWHPDVALAVAVLLVDAAEALESQLATGDDPAEDVLTLYGSEIAVARAYLARSAP